MEEDIRFVFGTASIYLREILFSEVSIIMVMVSVSGWKVHSGTEPGGRCLQRDFWQSNQEPCRENMVHLYGMFLCIQ